MLTLTFPDTRNPVVYPHTTFNGMGNLLRQTTLNLNAYQGAVERSRTGLEEQHILVGLIRHLGIDPNWELDEVVSYTRFRSNMLASTFNITTINRIGSVIMNGVYKDNARELWTLIENERSYNPQDISLDNIVSVVPFYSTRTRRGYRPNVDKSKVTTNQVEDLAIIGIDLVELAVGWWLYMQDDTYDGGPAAYAAEFVLGKAQLYHNQLAILNILYAFVVQGIPLDDCLTMDVVNFATVSEKKLLKEYLTFHLNWATDRRLLSLNHLMSQFKPIYVKDVLAFPERGLSGLLSQTVWSWEPMVLKWLAVYLTIANQMQYRASDYNSAIDRCIPAMKNRYKMIKAPYFMDHFTALADEVAQLNKQNMN